MITVSALGKDGNSILPDLAGSSPGGGLVTTGSARYSARCPGDVIRGQAGYWAVITDVTHNGRLGLTTFAALESDGSTFTRTEPSDCSGEVRTDCRIDPDTLWALHGKRECPHPGFHTWASCPDREYADQRGHDVAWMTAAERNALVTA